MSEPIRVRVDPTNPGQFFACCGLLELADRLWSEAEGWFEGCEFRIRSAGSLAELIQAVGDAKLTQLDPEDNTGSAIEVCSPFRPLRLDWWQDERAGGKDLKVWAGSMESYGIARAMQLVLRGAAFQDRGLFNVGMVVPDPDDGTKKKEPYYFDARRAPNAHSRDVGFAPNDLGMTTVAFPAVELLCLVGLQRCLPAKTDQPRLFKYYTWAGPILPELLRAVFPASSGCPVPTATGSRTGIAPARRNTRRSVPRSRFPQESNRCPTPTSLTATWTTMDRPLLSSGNTSCRWKGLTESYSPPHMRRAMDSPAGITSITIRAGSTSVSSIASVLTVRFLQPYSHGRGGAGDPEWPPSPLRAFQALVAAAAARWNERIHLEYAVPALRWLESQPAPMIVAAPGVQAEVKYRLYVPDNVADKVARSWSGGREASIADYRTEKDVRPTHLLGDAVYYLFPIAESDPEFERHRNTLIDASHSITHLGWGVDMVVGNATVLSEKDAAKLPGERWRPAEGASADGLRVPIIGTLNDLSAKHTTFLNRLPGDGFKPVPPLSMFRVVAYSRPTDIAPRPLAAFELRTPDFERSQPFNPTRHASAVAGMVRNALADLARQMRPFGWNDAAINTFIHGHTPDGRKPAHGEGADRRFAYLPLPSLERRGGAGVVVTAIRRVLVVGPPGGDRQVAWARVLSGRELTPLHDTPPAALRLIDKPAAALCTDPNLGAYVGNGAVWSTVTPVVMPGHDDSTGLRKRLETMRDAQAKKRLLLRLDRRAEALLRKAFEQAGLPVELVRAAVLEWRHAGFRAGVHLSQRYHVPDSPKKLPTYHVRVRFPVPIRGPLSAGAGRYRGLGVFAAEGRE